LTERFLLGLIVGGIEPREMFVKPANVHHGLTTLGELEFARDQIV
jgi:hypothetical protein